MELPADQEPPDGANYWRTWNCPPAASSWPRAEWSFPRAWNYRPAASSWPRAERSSCGGPGTAGRGETIGGTASRRRRTAGRREARRRRGGRRLGPLRRAALGVEEVLHRRRVGEDQCLSVQQAQLQIGVQLIRLDEQGAQAVEVALDGVGGQAIDRRQRVELQALDELVLVDRLHGAQDGEDPVVAVVQGGHDSLHPLLGGGVMEGKTEDVLKARSLKAPGVPRAA